MLNKINNNINDNTRSIYEKYHFILCSILLFVEAIIIAMYLFYTSNTAAPERVFIPLIIIFYYFPSFELIIVATSILIWPIKNNNKIIWIPLINATLILIFYLTIQSNYIIELQRWLIFGIIPGIIVAICYVNKLHKQKILRTTHIVYFLISISMSILIIYIISTNKLLVYTNNYNLKNNLNLQKIVPTNFLDECIISYEELNSSDYKYVYIECEKLQDYNNDNYSGILMMSIGGSAKIEYGVNEIDHSSKININNIIGYKSCNYCNCTIRWKKGNYTFNLSSSMNKQGEFINHCSDMNKFEKYIQNMAEKIDSNAQYLEN